MSEVENHAVADARTPPVAVWQILEKLKGQELLDWRLAPLQGRASIKDRNLDIGFPFGWYPVALSSDLAKGEVRPLRYFSKDLAIWRGEDGQVRMVDAYCRHLGAHMGHGGKVHGNLLECPFHAWRYDGIEGIVREIPYSKSIPPQVKRKCTRTWHVTEANRWIWMWYHPEDIAPLFDVVHIPECSDPDWTEYDVHEWNVYGSIQNMAENGVDVAHFKYIHGTANVPLGDLRWGEWGRVPMSAERWARRGAKSMAASATIQWAPGRAGRVLPEFRKRFLLPVSRPSSWTTSMRGSALLNQRRKPKGSARALRRRSFAISANSSIRTR